MGRKFTIFALFYFVFEGKFQVQAPRGAYIRRGNLTEGFLHYDFLGLIFGGAYFRNLRYLKNSNLLQHKLLNIHNQRKKSAFHPFPVILGETDQYEDKSKDIWNSNITTLFKNTRILKGKIQLTFSYLGKSSLLQWVQKVIVCDF